MKKIGITALIATFIMNANLYSFDIIEDTFEFIFDDLAKIVGIVVIIGVAFFLLKKNSKKDSNDRE
ncbi:hypothetical protein [Brachyspira sp.]|uniref:hypothetical protein n=1 Tax=Brachyspira sp. TaxID=1977261 RepID=UPI00262DCE50|nr:hypothetical protein [Brachyspira sp.]